jgi:hypothetical protein
VKHNTLLTLAVVLIAITFFMFDIPGLTPTIPIRTQTTTDINTSSSGNTLLVSHVAGSVIRFGFNIYASGTTNVSLVYGTQVSTPCDTGTTTLTGPYAFVAQTGIVVQSDMVVPTGNDLCLDNGTGVQVGGSISWMTHPQ